MYESSFGRQLMGVVLAISGCAVTFLMLHHPSHFDNGPLTAIVHRGMIVAILLAQIGVLYFAIQLGILQPMVLALAILYSAGSISNVAAGLINGFIVPEWLTHIGTESRVDSETSELIRDFAWAINQNCARFGILAQAAAMLLTVLPLLRFVRNRTTVALVVVSLVAGLFCPAVLWMHQGRLNVHTAMLIYTFEAAWLLMVGIWLMRPNTAPSLSKIT